MNKISKIKYYNSKWIFIGPALDNIHRHPQFYNSHNNNNGHISNKNSENANLNNLRASQKRFFQKFEEKIHMFCETQEQYVSKKNRRYAKLLWEKNGWTENLLQYKIG